MNIWINIFFEIKILKSYLVRPNIMAIFMIKKLCSYNRWFSISIFKLVTFALLYPSATIELIIGRFSTQIPSYQDSIQSTSQFAGDPIITPILTTSMLGTITVSTPMVVIFASSDWVIPTLAGYFQVSTTIVFDTIGEVV